RQKVTGAGVGQEGIDLGSSRLGVVMLHGGAGVVKVFGHPGPFRIERSSRSAFTASVKVPCILARMLRTSSRLTVGSASRRAASTQAVSSLASRGLGVSMVTVRRWCS